MSRINIFYGWWIVAAGFVLLFLFAGAGFYSFSIFIKPLEAEFGWARASISLTMSIYFIIGGTISPLVGMLIQNYGLRRVMVFSAVGAGACFMLVGLTDSLGYFYIVYAFLAAMSCGIGPLSVSTLLAKWFNKRRGTATGLAMVGISAGGLVLAPVVGLITVHAGWKTAYVFLGMLIWVLGLPVVLYVIKDRPADLGLAPDGEFKQKKIGPAPGAGAHHISQMLDLEGWSSKAALHSRAFGWIAVAFFLAPLAQMGVLQHQVPLIMDTGISQSAAASALGVIAGIGGVGKLSFGKISEILPFKWVVMLCFGLQALAIFVLLNLETTTLLWVYVVVFGFAMGGVVVLMPLIVGHFFGLASFGVILGTLWMIQALGGALGTYSAGLIYDFFNSYQWVLYTFIVAYLMAILAIFLAGRPQPYAAGQDVMS